MKFVYDDGGRSKYFKSELVGDCACRAIAIATQTDYREVYDLINEFSKRERTGTKKRGISSARDGVYIQTMQNVMQKLGWQWHPLMKIGLGCTVHLKESELPAGRIVVRLSKHYSAVIDGVIHDTYDCSRDGARCVYGYWSQD